MGRPYVTQHSGWHREINQHLFFINKIVDDQKGVSKLTFLTAKDSIAKIEWQELQPDERNTWLTEGLHSDFAAFIPMGIKEAKISSNFGTSTIFRMYSGGVKTNRDLWVYDFDRNVLITKIKRFIETYNGELDRWRRRSSSSSIIDDFVTYDDKRIKWSGDLKNQLKRGKDVAYLEKNIRQCLYHPFVKKYLYFDPLLNDRRLLQYLFFPTIDAEVGNAMIIVSDLGHRTSFSAFATNIIPELHLLATTDAFQCFPYYTYSEDGSNRRENITDWSLTQFQSKYGSNVTKWDIFHYVYAMLPHPQYRERYAENLKRDLPHIPLLQSQTAFQTCARIGQQLMHIHLHYEQAREYPLQWIENPTFPFSWQVKRMRLTADRTAVTINESLTLAGIPPECFAYRLGNRSALDWIIDQYQLSEDKRSGIISDPNRPDDEEYIVRLLCKVITVSLETVNLVQELAQQVQQKEWLNTEM